MPSIIRDVNGLPAVLLSGADAKALVAPLLYAAKNLQGTYTDRTRDAAIDAITDTAYEFGKRTEMSVVSDCVANASPAAQSVEKGKWLTTAQASRLFERDVRTITRWCRRHMVAARKEGKIWLVEAGQPHPTSYAN